MTDEDLAQIEAEAKVIGARGTVAGTAFAAHVPKLIAEVRRLQAALQSADIESAAAIDRVSKALVADKWNATAAFQERAEKAEARVTRLEQDLEDARRMYREDMGRDDQSDAGEPCEVCGDPTCDHDSCGAPDCIHGVTESGDTCPTCLGQGAGYSSPDSDRSNPHI